MAGSKIAQLAIAASCFSLLYSVVLLAKQPCQFYSSLSKHESFLRSSSLRQFLDPNARQLDTIQFFNAGSEQSGLKSDAGDAEVSNISVKSDSVYSAEKIGHETGLAHIVFGIASSARFWDKRKNYVKLWWRPEKMRGFVWLDEPVNYWSDNGYPSAKISEDISRFKYTHKRGKSSAIRISRIVSETFRLGLPNVHWFVMGDDDTVFIPDNLVRVLSKYNHRKYFYIGYHSESHGQNIRLSYNMAFGGGGFALSFALANALEKMQDECIQRYPYLYGSDERIQACMAELGVPLTEEPGFHQFDIRGDAFGLLAAHPLNPLVSMHHLDEIKPLFPNMTQLESLQHLKKAMDADPGGLLQQSICYDRSKRWSVSISLGYVIQIYRGLIPPRDLERPARTFLNWRRRIDEMGLTFNSRNVSKDPCEKPCLFFMKNSRFKHTSSTMSTYSRYSGNNADCSIKTTSPSSIDLIQVEKEIYNQSWHLNLRRQCCRIGKVSGKTMHILVGSCKSEEIIN